ncbi:DNA-directed RNA polymerases I and III 40 kDa polypeptide-like protein [Microdochium trichocladiopsis]|uniref:DNA-directed RNA polymerases I and III subunit RPAC1 n=1 Tax=Microdochium trichocladiopsis TaxID=1682393 RepID=A0A9P9BW86_9PEZI|nr:DNA-directed RNA polymerases I and III 40 kDa polypeptide-like protein [Microdochium trichocladiopsis]KAH7034831.1 DNA-directed RNA polymerases I and III 40 kDa polypeptide-like protein [Microdochium trichocladiopsis]
MAPSSGRKGAKAATAAADEIPASNIVGINKETVTNTVSTDYPGHYVDEDHAWDKEHFRSNFRVQFHANDQHEAQFSLVGVDASIANAFRRILIAEIPTLAIDIVFMHNNTSVIQDEVLAHRLGLIPFTGSKRGIRDWMRFFKPPAEGQDTYDTTFDNNTVSLKLAVKCEHNKDAPADSSDPKELYHNAHVYARDIEFQPLGGQEQYFSGPEGAIRPVNPDILVAKLRPGQEVDIEMHMHKGYGWDHAKWSPVSTASYRLMPIINITRPVLGDDARKFQSCFPEGVIALEKVTRQEAKTAGSGYEGHEGEVKAVVADPMRDTVSREVLRHPEFEGKVKLGRRKNHFIFSIESTGQWDSDELFVEAVKTLKRKCQRLRPAVLQMVQA